MTAPVPIGTLAPGTKIRWTDKSEREHTGWVLGLDEPSGRIRVSPTEPHAGADLSIYPAAWTPEPDELVEVVE